MSEARVPDLCLRSNRHRGCSDAGSGPVVAASGSSLYVTDERAHAESWQYPQSRREDLVLGQGSLTSAGTTRYDRGTDASRTAGSLKSVLGSNVRGPEIIGGRRR